MLITVTIFLFTAYKLIHGNNYNNICWFRYELNKQPSVLLQFRFWHMFFQIPKEAIFFIAQQFL